MHIGINTLGMPLGNTGGLQTYTEELICALAKIDQANRYTVFVHKDAGDHYRVNNPNFNYVYCHVAQNWMKWSVIWRNSFFYSVVRKSKVDLLHSPANLAPFFLPCPSIVTVHDAISFKETPSVALSSLKNYFWSLAIKKGIQKAKAVITVSRVSGQDLLEVMPSASHKIKVIYHGIPSFSPLSPSKNFSLPQKPYVLWVGRTAAHKNILRLLQAFALLIRTQKIEHALYLAGMKGPQHIKIMKEIKKLNLTHRVIFLDFCERQTLKAFYEHASLFVFPSLIEGFGFPILEAMFCGVPVVTSHYGAMKEIAGEAAYFIDPQNVTDIACGMWEVLKDKSLQEKLIEKGKKRVQSFSWDACAKETLNVYET